MNKRYKRKDDGKELTHTSMGNVKGAWSISKEDYPEFIRLYKQFSKKNIGAFVERSPKIAPFYFDVDFHTEKQVRYYKDNFIRTTIKKLVKIMSQFFQIPENDNTLHAYLFEKFEPSPHNDGGYKDGFHIMFPELILTVESRYYIYDKFMEELEKDNFVQKEKIPYTNELHEIFDKSVIYDNGVLMYGAAKDGREPYKLTKIYNEHCIQILPEINNTEYYESDSSSSYRIPNHDSDTDSECDTVCNSDNSDNSDNDTLSVKSEKSGKSGKSGKSVKSTKSNQTKNTMNTDMSMFYNNDCYNEIMEWNDIIDATVMRRYENDENAVIRPATKRIEEDIMEIYDTKYSKNKKKKPVENEEFNSTDFKKNKNKKRKDDINENDIRLAELLVLEVFKPERARDYETWRNVGWALHNIDDGQDMLNVFHNFSKRAGNKKYDAAGCNKLWKEARNEGYSIASLRKWAREDNEKEYFKILSQIYEEILKKTSSGTHYDVAEFVSTLYKGQYVCVNRKKDLWYEFKNNRWHYVEGGGSLYNNLSEQIPKYLNELVRINKYQLLKSQEQQNEKEDKDIDFKTNMLKSQMKLMNDLKQVSFKRNIMVECSYKLYDQKFAEKLDANPYLLGFENGVYCLKPNNKGVPLGFREGVPEDYVSLSTGYDYIDEPDDEYIKNIENFFKSSLPNENVRNYVVTFIATALVGITMSKFPFWIGRGGNGKSIALDMCKYAFGDYYSPLGIAYLTKPRKDPSEAQPELVALVGRRLVGMQESEAGEKLYISKLKELTGGDTQKIRGLYESPIDFKPQAKFILATNKLPEIENIDGGLTRRVRCVEWNMKFVDEEDFDPNNPKHAIRDNELQDKIQSVEWRQNLMWYLINVVYPKYLQEGLKEPDEVKERSGKYFANNDKFGSFLRICTEKCPDNERHDLSHIYDELKEFYKTRYGNVKVPTLQGFIEYLENNDIKVTQKSKNTIYVNGIKQRKDDDEMEHDDIEA
jgi:P4 family phage/plasmid primase-like protien